MRIIERSLVIATLLISGLLIFAAAGRSGEQKAHALVFDGNDCKDMSATEACSVSEKESAPAFVANPFCKACHLDFDEEELALRHEIWGIGCERCHGESFRHRSDEANITPPEIMYPKERINPACMMCHPRHDINYLKDHAPILEAGLSIFETEPSDKNAKKYCTDCHGVTHRMKTRTTRWDKQTGALLKRAE
ncbi:MAG: hypothetical protein A2Y76_14625 [Planctomycetes bacterium RBG_13_60_9]|nr:MAG: hypothetical protein A2Y76_14625 [Planctomycetes bacterium RBG_13_60_9]